MYMFRIDEMKEMNPYIGEQICVMYKYINYCIEHASNVRKFLFIIKLSPLYKAIPENITSLLPSVLLRVRSTSNNAKGNKRVIFFSV